MLTRAFVAAVATAFIAATCGPTLPPTTAPAQPDPTFDPFRTLLQAYVDQTQPFRRQAAQAGENVPGKASGRGTGSATSLRTRQNSLADALRTRLRPNAKQGDLFTAPTSAAIKHQLENAFASERKDLILDELAEQNTTPANAAQPTINQQLKAPRLPPRLIELLPPLPKQLEYDFVGRTIVLRDIDADVVVDYLPDALPVQSPTQNVEESATPGPAGATSPLPMPNVRGAVLFALMGDSGSGDKSQLAVAQAMLTYFTTARRFPFELMLGDNLYDDDYEGEFLKPYKPLIDRGVKFYAALGNHDRDLEIHFKPFNMGDKDRYSFDQGNARVAVLNSNHPADPEQIKYLNTVFADAGDKWRIAFFHHPLYSSGRHAAESRDVIRPALEQSLVRNRINVVFSGHEHLYERIKPQQGVAYFVSGGGGRYLYSVRPSDFDQVAVSDHHFMVAMVIGDRLLFETISHSQKLIDCGMITRVANVRGTDTSVQKWMQQCEAMRPGGPRRTDQ
jgi:hypothetical protein